MIFAAEEFCAECASKIMRDLEKTDLQVFSCRGTLACGRKFRPIEVPGWPNGTLDESCWYTCPDCGEHVALDEYLYDSDDFPKGSPDDQVECCAGCGYSDCEE